ncbi:MAG: DUF21 domain-containing protein, partial [Candidatus Omnitrophica bacterium]|nr:DUF21 domain-containing protein [Candidatus Omnitrophota bacterium]
MFAAQHPEKVALFVAKPMSLLIVVLRPIVNIFMRIGNFLIRLFGGNLKQRSPLITAEELKLMIEVGKEEGAVSDEERKM